MAVLSQHYLQKTKEAALNERCREQTRLPSLCLSLSLSLSRHASARAHTHTHTRTHTHTHTHQLRHPSSSNVWQGIVRLPSLLANALHKQHKTQNNGL